nr:immunoglobulin light chain junction region [Macaca mulatta]
DYYCGSWDYSGNHVF